MAALRPYETMIIFDPEVEEPSLQQTLERALEVVRSNGGAVGEVARWGKRTLAYEMRHRKEGVYVLAGFSAEPRAASELDRVLHLADEVLRHKIIRLPDAVAARGASKVAPPPPPPPPSPGRSERTQRDEAGAEEEPAGPAAGTTAVAEAPEPAPAAAAAEAGAAPVTEGGAEESGAEESGEANDG